MATTRTSAEESQVINLTEKVTAQSNDEAQALAAMVDLTQLRLAVAFSPSAVPASSESIAMLLAIKQRELEMLIKKYEADRVLWKDQLNNVADPYKAREQELLAEIKRLKDPTTIKEVELSRTITELNAKLTKLTADLQAKHLKHQELIAQYNARDARYQALKGVVQPLIDERNAQTLVLVQLNSLVKANEKQQQAQSLENKQLQRKVTSQEKDLQNKTIEQERLNKSISLWEKELRKLTNQLAKSQAENAQLKLQLASNTPELSQEAAEINAQLSITTTTTTITANITSPSKRNHAELNDSNVADKNKKTKHTHAASQTTLAKSPPKCFLFSHTRSPEQAPRVEFVPVNPTEKDPKDALQNVSPDNIINSPRRKPNGV